MWIPRLDIQEGQRQDGVCQKEKEEEEKQQEDSGTRSQVVMPYVKQVSETVARVLRKHHVSVAMRPVNTLKRLLVHPKDKQEKEETTECVYKIPCGNCDRTYVGETGRKFGVRLKEHRSEVEAKSNKAFTRSQQAASLTERSKSALTDHASQNNHVIDWSEATVVDREPDRVTRWIKEAVHIRKEGKKSMNRDEGCYTLSHVYDTVLATSLPYRDKNCRKRRIRTRILLLMKDSDRVRNVKVNKKFWLRVLMNILRINSTNQMNLFVETLGSLIDKLPVTTTRTMSTH